MINSKSPLLRLDSVSHQFGAQHVLHDINLDVPWGQFLSLVGSSGVGKSTLLAIILGILAPSAGKAVMEGRVIKAPGRDRGIVFQRYALFPFLTALENVAIGLRFDRIRLIDRVVKFWRTRREWKAMLAEAAAQLERFGLANAIDQYPHEMSGGMCQRVSIAQTLIMKPKLLLLDEPFGALDEASRVHQQEMLLQLRSENEQARNVGREPPFTIVIITHELSEAIYVSDRIIALSRHWDWSTEGYSQFPGATVVYDEFTPPFPRSRELSRSGMREQHAEIRRVALESDCRVQRARAEMSCK